MFAGKSQKNSENFEVFFELWLTRLFTWVALEVYGHSVTALTNTAKEKKS